MAFVSNYAEKIVIDKERNASLKRTNWEGRIRRSYFELTWNGSRITFTAEDNSETLHKEGKNYNIIYWHILGWNIPPSTDTDIEEVKKIVTEALDAYGFNYSKKFVSEVHVDFSKTKDISKNLI